MALHDVLAARRDDVVRRWKAEVRGALAPKAMPNLELENHIPVFVDEIASALRAESGLSDPGPSPNETDTAAGHGAQRLRLGFSLDAVVREYGALRDAIVDIAIEAGAEPSLGELQVLFDTLIAGIAFAVTEYTHQRDAELLRQANEHFAFVAHELRNPLSSAMTAFTLLKGKGQLPSDSRSLGALERGLHRTSELIDQTLQVARVASGIELHRRPTTLKALFEDAELGAISDAESKDVEIRVRIENDQPIELDTRLVRSALGNLLRNAVKYTASRSAVQLRGAVANGRATIEVEDRCGGLSPGKVEAAFAPFVRLDNQQSGFGLGLAIAKQAVDAHGGSIRVQNLPGRGCIFVLELPV
jgi:signal transduction histidine kinase